MAVDDVGEMYVPLPRGRRAYDAEQLRDYLGNRRHLRALTSMVRDALFQRFVEHVRALA